MITSEGSSNTGQVANKEKGGILAWNRMMDSAGGENNTLTLFPTIILLFEMFSVLVTVLVILTA